MSRAPIATPDPSLRLRPAEPRDVDAIVELIRGLAEFEKLTHLLASRRTRCVRICSARVRSPRRWSPKSMPRSSASRSFFTNFSTFLAQPGLYLEDLFVRPSHRGRGIGEALLTRLAQLAVERDYGRFEWSVLDWNEHAIRFYERMGRDR
jgi:GNAT superfamily N-acetyltransferase